jgi:cytochrome c-type biogenesis protein CcmF
LIYMLVSGHYEVAYVARVTSDAMPVYLKITALWGGQAGSLLFWSWLMSAFASAVMLRKWERDKEFLPWVIVVTLVTLAFFLMLALFIDNPFQRAWMTSAGLKVALFQPVGSFLTRASPQGLNPLLWHYGMVFHPPLLYLGFVSFVIPFAFAIAALITGRSDERWIRITRRWTLAAWLFLSAGLILGMRWAYDVLGWGGYWGWDPVEVAALLPWLPGTAFLHSVVIQEKRNMLKHWNMVLVVLTFEAVIIGTFFTRSGVLSSVHAFAESAIGPLLLCFVIISAAASLALVLWRWNSLKTEVHMTSLFWWGFLSYASGECCFQCLPRRLASSARASLPWRMCSLGRRLRWERPTTNTLQGLCLLPCCCSWASARWRPGVTRPTKPLVGRCGNRWLPGLSSRAFSRS